MDAMSEDVLREAWEGEQPAKQVGILSYVLKMRDKLEQLPELAHANGEEAHLRQKRAYDKSSKQHTFQPEQRVLLPSSSPYRMAGSV